MSRLRFDNRDARPRIRELEVAPEDLADVVQWYGAFHAGDAYTVTVDGTSRQLTADGELLPEDKGDEA